eukprot:TRINITY_DN6776_c0_g1_i3.p2 TRINITY_DN6776_c0_g1~~TRINITY_DN6776_c0_g1_i3.p2  ORF type:complete len:174 (-),score=18.66 TRINITY_DN6776_c0_g1_i3:152-673(-)
MFKLRQLQGSWFCNQEFSKCSIFYEEDFSLFFIAFLLLHILALVFQVELLSSGQTLGVKAQRFRGHTSPHRNVKEKKSSFEKFTCVAKLYQTENKCVDSDQQNYTNKHNLDEKQIQIVKQIVLECLNQGSFKAAGFVIRSFLSAVFFMKKIFLYFSLLFFFFIFWRQYFKLNC